VIFWLFMLILVSTQAIWLKHHWHDRPESRIGYWLLISYKINGAVALPVLAGISIAGIVGEVIEMVSR